MQETYVRICQIDNQNTSQQPKSLVLKTARNLALDYVKRAETRLADSVEYGRDFGNTEQQNRDGLFAEAFSHQEFTHFCEMDVLSNLSDIAPPSPRQPTCQQKPWLVFRGEYLQ